MLEAFVSLLYAFTNARELFTTRCSSSVAPITEPLAPSLIWTVTFPAPWPS